MPRSKDDSDNDSDDNGGSDAMMSIFASYYGIDDDDSNTKGIKKKGKSQEIDSAHFDSDEYVRDLLESTPIEKLVQQDSSMVHEIRSLDSDMQMLVYENYSKFIAATETIRRMKSNVEAMHDDMESVKFKMETIGTSSAQLDASLSSKQSKVAKLVRVRRLLTRLTFLSELPEKLAEMIDREQYSKAVRLYSKTINVLKQHSHVLSFKNIQERTEQMMQDLRGKVMNLLDDPSLDAVKLTQYVAVVRLMEAPRKQVIDKFLSAHKSRASRMIRQFIASNSISPVKGAQTPSSFYTSGNDKVDSARKFHQSYVAGLIECCKGICELFIDSPSLAIMSPNSKLEINVQKGKDGDHDIDAEIAKNKFESTLAILMPEYSSAIASAIANFYERYNANMQSYIALEKELEVLNNSKDTAVSDVINESSSLSQQLRSAQLRAYDFEEERQSWVMLTRQAILDCQFLDSEISDCIQKTCNMESAPVFKYADSFSQAILAVLDVNNEASFSRRVKNFIQSKLLASLPSLCKLCLVNNNSGSDTIISTATTSSTDSSNPNFDGQSSSSRARTLGNIQRMSTKAQNQLDGIVEAFLSTLSEVCADSRPIVEVHAVYKGSKGQDTSIKMIQKFIDVICSMIEDTLRLSLQSGRFVDGNLEDLDNEIFVENFFDANNVTVFNIPPLNLNFNANSTLDDTITNPFGDDNSDKKPDEMTKNDTGSKDIKAKELSISMLIILAFFKKLLNINGGLMQKIDGILRTHELPSLFSSSQSSKTIELNCIGRVRNLCQNLLTTFIDHNASQAFSYISESILKAVSSHPLPPITLGTNSSEVQVEGLDSRVISAFLSSLKVSVEVIDLIVYLDHLLTSCCVILAESPPQIKLTATDDRLTMNRRGSTRQSMIGSRGSIMGVRAEVGLQLDIERLFAQKIKIFDKEAIIGALNTGTILETALFTLLKAVIKGGQEQSKLRTLSHSAYVSIQADIMCIRQLSSVLLKDNNDIDSLCDQWLSSLFTRYIYANDIVIVSDANETTAISRAANEGLLTATKNTYIIV